MRWVLLVEQGTVLDADDGCPDIFGEYCGGCDACMALQAAHAGVDVATCNYVPTAYEVGIRSGEEDS